MIKKVSNTNLDDKSQKNSPRNKDLMQIYGNDVNTVKQEFDNL